MRSAAKCSEGRGYLSVYSERSVCPTHQHQHAELVANGDFAVGDEDRVGKRPGESLPVSNSKRHEYSPLWPGVRAIMFCGDGKSILQPSPSELPTGASAMKIRICDDRLTLAQTAAEHAV